MAAAGALGNRMMIENSKKDLKDANADGQPQMPMVSHQDGSSVVRDPAVLRVGVSRSQMEPPRCDWLLCSNRAGHDGWIAHWGQDWSLLRSKEFISAQSYPFSAFMLSHSESMGQPASECSGYGCCCRRASCCRCATSCS